MSDIITHYLTRDEAIRFIKKHRRARQCFVRVGTFLYTQVPTDDDDTARGYDGSTLVPVGAKVATKVVQDLFGKAFAQRGCKVRVGLASNCIFIG